ncbi:MAG: pilus assembly protein [Hydrogenophilaceae bacterium]|jgi:Flp pilus assembly protein TadG|nr:pilus assembly protein [Hydrogenophilaceae bacterium]
MQLRRAARPKAFRADPSGAAAIEFALIGPLLIALLMGIVSYGGYFWLGHTVQQMANDAARASIAGLTDAEREALARESLAAAAAAAHGQLRPERLDVEVARTAGYVTVRVEYDAEGSIFWAFDKLIPMPPARLARAAAIRMGGF